MPRTTFFLLIVVLLTCIAAVSPAPAKAPVRKPAPEETATPETTPTPVETSPVETVKQPPIFPKDHHTWAHFEPGVWKTCRVVTETLNEQGEVVSVNLTTTTTSLERVGESDYALRIEATVEVQGKKFPGQPQIITYGLFGQAEGETTHVTEADEEVFALEGQPFPCRAWIVESTSEAKSRTTKLLYTSGRSPYVLRRETTTTAADEKLPSSTTTEQVVAIDMPHKISGDILTASHIRIVRKTPKGTSITLAVHCDKIPGGVVYHTSKELDTDGRLIRRSTLELTDYDFQSDRRSLRQRRARHGRQSENADGSLNEQALGLSATTRDHPPATAAEPSRASLPSRVSIPR